MDDISKKSFATLLDELQTTNMKLWFAQETVMSKQGDDIVAAAAKNAQRLNARRNALMRAIDERIGDGGIALTEKTYA